MSVDSIGCDLSQDHSSIDCARSFAGTEEQPGRATSKGGPRSLQRLPQPAPAPPGAGGESNAAGAAGGHGR